MFQNWQFLISEMIGLLLLAAILGIIVGWIIWGGRKEAAQAGLSAADETALRERLAQQEAEIARLSHEVEAKSATVEESAAQDMREEITAPPAAPEVEPEPELAVAEEQESGERQPQALEAPQEGGADDLKKIKGIGPKLEQLCNGLGIYHFAQIAAWQSAEVAWMDSNLKGFKGRVSRDDWVSQAKTLAAGETTEFSSRVDKGEVY